MKPPRYEIVVLISADSEWRVACSIQNAEEIKLTPFGEWFYQKIGGHSLCFAHGGWGKISAAASAQYFIDHWKPGLVINLGTCGGLAGQTQKGELVLVKQTLVYDIVEQMGDPQEAIAHYTVDLDLSWLRNPLPAGYRNIRMVSADHDILAEDVPNLIQKYGAVAADWESGAIAWVCRRNEVRCLILRGVTDIVGVTGGEAYGNPAVFYAGTQQVMAKLLNGLPAWLDCLGPIFSDEDEGKIQTGAN